MEIGPRGEKRPDDPVSRAVMIGKISTGEIEEEFVEGNQVQDRPPRSSRPSGSKNGRKAEITPPTG